MKVNKTKILQRMHNNNVVETALNSTQFATYIFFFLKGSIEQTIEKTIKKTTDCT